MKEFDALLYELEKIVEKSMYVEDGKLYLKCALKYDTYNLVKKYDSNFIAKVHKYLEYTE